MYHRFSADQFQELPVRTHTLRSFEIMKLGEVFSGVIDTTIYVLDNIFYSLSYSFVFNFHTLNLWRVEGKDQNNAGNTFKL